MSAADNEKLKKILLKIPNKLGKYYTNKGIIEELASISPLIKENISFADTPYGINISGSISRKNLRGIFNVKSDFFRYTNITIFNKINSLLKDYKFQLFLNLSNEEKWDKLFFYQDFFEKEKKENDTDQKKIWINQILPKQVKQKKRRCPRRSKRYSNS